MWEEFIICKENKKEKKEEETQKEAIAKEGAEKIQQFAMGKLRKHDTKAAPKENKASVHKDKEIRGVSDCLHQNHQAIKVHPLYLVPPA